MAILRVSSYTNDWLFHLMVCLVVKPGLYTKLLCSISTTFINAITVTLLTKQKLLQLLSKLSEPLDIITPLSMCSFVGVVEQHTYYFE